MRVLQVIVVIFFSGLLLTGCSLLKGPPAGLEVISNITSKVTIDGKEVGSTPFKSTDFTVKKYTVRITPSDTSLSPHDTSLKLYTGYVAQLDWNFGKSDAESSGVIFEYDAARDKQKAELQLVASPDNVPIMVDGKNVGFTPLLLEDLADGNHSITFQAPGYSNLDRTVKLIKGTRIMMTVKLAKQLFLQPTPPPAGGSIATESAQIATASAKKPTPPPTSGPKATPKTSTASAKVSPSPSPIATASASGVVKKTTSNKPYVEVLTTPTDFLRVRSSPSASATELYKLAVGSTVPYASASSSGWLKVQYDGTKTGWVSGEYSKLIE